jgi:hypothetical protein
MQFELLWLGTLTTKNLFKNSEAKMKFRDKYKNVPVSEQKSGLGYSCVYCCEDRKMLSKQTAVLAET